MHLSTIQYVFRKRRFRKLLGILLLTSLILTMLVLPFERAAGGPIQTPFDAMYWSLSTMTSVGYGDYTTITVVGKTIAMCLQLVGALTFGMVVVLLTLSLNRIEAEFSWRRTQTRFDDLEEKLDRIERSMSYIVRKTEDESDPKQTTS